MGNRLTDFFMSAVNKMRKKRKSFFGPMKENLSSHLTELFVCKKDFRPWEGRFTVWIHSHRKPINLFKILIGFHCGFCWPFGLAIPHSEMACVLSLFLFSGVTLTKSLYVSGYLSQISPTGYKVAENCFMYILLLYIVGTNHVFVFFCFSNVVNQLICLSWKNGLWEQTKLIMSWERN